SVLDLAGRSILSEFDNNLKVDYGIFGLVSDEKTIEEKLYFYSGESFRNNPNRTSLFNLKVKNIRVDLSSYALTNLKRFEEQIVRYMKHQVSFDSINVLDLLDEFDLSSGANDYEEDNKRRERSLKNSRVINNLPSRQLEYKNKGILDILDLPDIGELGNIGMDRILLALYISDHFRHKLDSSAWDKTFFVNEIEYILAGRLSDRSNSNFVKSSLLALRAGINLTHINSDPQKKEAIAAAASIITPGPKAEATKIIIAGLWASAEALNDIKRLEKGGRVPLIKTSEDWVLSLESVLEDKYEDLIGTKDKEEGLKYEDYLFLFLCFKNKEVVLIRIMDLIQLNMQGNYNENFYLSRCYFGFGYNYNILKKFNFLMSPSYKNGIFEATHVY
ncbi:MAG: hypothetical protein GX076_07915, partial [Clostridiales bacterium]|nr:hypothetical protein [Clostridiales bacterium]